MAMNNLNIFKLLDALATYENGLENFDDYAKRYDVYLLAFWEHIRDCKERYTDEEPDRRIAFDHVYKGTREYSIRGFQTLYLEFCNRLYDFILLQEIKTTASGQRNIAKMCRKHGFDQEIVQANASALDKAEELPVHKRAQIQWEVYDEVYYHNEEKTKTELQQAVAYLDNYYAINKLRYLIDELTLCRGTDEAIDSTLRKKVAHHLKSLATNEIPLIQIQLAAIRFFRKPSLAAFYQFKTVYFELVDKIDAYRSFLLISLTNALSILSLPDEEARKEYAIIYRFGIWY